MQEYALLPLPASLVHWVCEVLYQSVSSSPTAKQNKSSSFLVAQFHAVYKILTSAIYLNRFIFLVIHSRNNSVAISPNPLINFAYPIPHLLIHSESPYVIHGGSWKHSTSSGTLLYFPRSENQNPVFLVF